jgi:mRNA deadenylase 3'-5' endonuclease subunit Ccr4
MGGCESHDEQEDFRLDNIVAEIKAMTTLDLLSVPKEPNSKKCTGFDFAILSYSIKSEWPISPMKVFAKYENYKHSLRCKRVIEKLKIYCPDIIFLQECNDINLYKTQLEAIGYATFAATKKSIYQNDGLIIAARRTIFKIYETKVIEFDRSHRAKNNSTFQIGHVALAAKFIHVGSGKRVNVINMNFFPDRVEEAVQYHQMSELMKFINEEYKEDDIVVWGGNMEATPNSNLIEYIQSRKKPSHIDKSMHDNMNSMFCELEGMDSKMTWGNAYSFYGKASDSMKEYPKFTYSDGIDQLVIDHLFYSTKSLSPESLLALEDSLNENLPNINNPSNHLPIMVNFEILA